MKYLKDSTWENLPVDDFRPRFFVETYVEKLSIFTPHFAQSRLMNVFSSSSEALGYIDEYISNEKNASYLLSALDEIDSCLGLDPVAKSLFAHIDGPREELFKKLRKGDRNPNDLTRLRVICRAILGQEDAYVSNLLEQLKIAIFDQEDLNKKSRITNKIYSLTGLYTTHLLSRGFSPTYLFNRAEMFTRENNYQGRSFREQFDLITDRLRTYTTEHNVYFAIRAHKPASLLAIGDDPLFSFSGVLPVAIQQTLQEKLSRDFVPNVIACASVETTDHISASWYVKDKLDQLLDAVTALDLNPKIQVSAHCVTIAKHQALAHPKAININLLLGFLSSEGGSNFSNASPSIREALRKLNPQGYEQLGRSLRYLRLAREAISLEQKLLNLWIALESLFSGGQSTIMANILDYVPQIYAVAALRRRVCYLRDLFLKAKVETTPLLRQELGFGQLMDESVTEDQVFRLLRREDAAQELFGTLDPKDHLKFKVLATFEEMKSNASIGKRLRQSEVDVERQLRRIYFLRNKIAHTGHYSNIRPQLVTHLLDYVVSCYLALSVSAGASPDEEQTVDELLAAYKMGADLVKNRVNSEVAIDELAQLIPIPIS